MAWGSLFASLIGRRQGPEAPAPETVRALGINQRALAEEIESLCRSLEERVQHLADRLAGLTQSDADAEIRDIERAQNDLKLLLRRVNASAQPTAQLLRELSEWEARAEEGELHADHPMIRSEIIRSELAGRGHARRAPPTPSYEEGARGSWLDETASELTRQVEDEPEVQFEEVSDTSVFSVRERVDAADSASLLRAIHDATREAEKWHGAPADEYDEDALLQMKHLRELHALLKRADREQGIERDRMELAMRVNENA